jgi:hypothetical protein
MNALKHNEDDHEKFVDAFKVIVELKGFSKAPD